ncbi:DEAD/DEAH box helicase [Jiella pelagia]|uniref:Helicase n=1 Tax=Jiella pelagia TaxID=2986949 RepID=A0ABY7BXH5_9HYPH|nr:helicase [Jiella pelagia]WAP67213.1 helicase [Jiella pelagia]
MTVHQDYGAFLAAKARLDPPTGLAVVPELPEALFQFQRDVTGWALRRGRAALFAGTGLGKTLMELSWGDAIARETGGMVLLFAPLAVSAQVIREAKKFGIAARAVSQQSDCGPGINVTNYQKIEHFSLSAFVGLILDESSILKSTSGHYRTRLIVEAAPVPFRLAATATPAPNDFMELGNHAEFLGAMSHSDMLATFFTHDGGETQKWRLKGHAEDDFWRWLASIAVMIRRPSDLGYEDGAYRLPPIRRHQRTVRADYRPSLETGTLFPMEARTLGERLAARRDSVDERVAMAAELTPRDRPFVWWCNLNSESDALAKAIPGAVEVRGSDAPEEKERKLIGFSEGRIRVLVTKASIAGFGMNWQHCADTGFVGLSDSFEQVYQAERRFWRFGQEKPVNVHFIAAETEGAVVANLRRKEADAEKMAAAMVRHMADLSSAAVRGQAREIPAYDPRQAIALPDFLARGAAA